MGSPDVVDGTRMMEYRPLGRTDMQVSLLGLGTVKLGRDQQVRYAEPFSIPDDVQVTRLLALAQELGINLIDTAPAYGDSEERLGRLLPGPRDDWLICTKVGEEFTDGNSRFDFSAVHVRRSVERSLTRLHTDYLDIVLIHSDGDDVRILDESDALETLVRLKQRGSIRAIGISHKTAAGAERAVTLGCDVIMSPLSRNQTDQRDAIARAGECGCGVLIKKALGGGFAAPETLHWVAQQPGVCCIVTGTINSAHLAANAAVLSL